MEIKNRDGKVCVYTFIKNIKELYIASCLKIYLLLIHKKITKLSCSFFCNFDCFHMREPSGFLMLLLLLLLLFFEPRRFLFQILIGKLSPGLFSQGPILYFQPNFPIISGYYAFFSLLQGERPFT